MSHMFMSLVQPLDLPIQLVLARHFPSVLQPPLWGPSCLTIPALAPQGLISIHLARKYSNSMHGNSFLAPTFSEGEFFFAPARHAKLESQHASSSSPTMCYRYDFNRSGPRTLSTTRYYHILVRSLTCYHVLRPPTVVLLLRTTTC